ncbi:hypothetical protein SAMN05421504_111170 [Amycolatopsis xylanica]|uniref:Glyoxalase-like domain-containing protein n=1 Tax=Amycolatopsis xylanica TaxID=589385 RepID=A0A1H3RL54_9PSEU|nr:VOC family protein [Amycolatopsis xylanica]SDZ26396.1 hypothetical protein SAMN05421504_111170 [Amycolatopsis xylanica]
MTSIIAITVDCQDAEKLAAFWQQALGYAETRRWRDGHGLTYVELRGKSGIPLLFQPVGEGKRVKNRVHIDIAPAELGQYAEIDRLTTLGARVLTDDPAEHFVVLADPEGNEFCVLPQRDPDELVRDEHVQ